MPSNSAAAANIRRTVQKIFDDRKRRRSSPYGTSVSKKLCPQAVMIVNMEAPYSPYSEVQTTTARRCVSPSSGGGGDVGFFYNFFSGTTEVKNPRKRCGRRGGKPRGGGGFTRFPRRGSWTYCRRSEYREVR